ncbi:MAG TPA: hypothetical protein VL463_27185 [Kofleriaceae bacterium]|jgi:hypothetical protein|nr:hypothetical protein [Kofleriaceae bacterium]
MRTTPFVVAGAIVVAAATASPARADADSLVEDQGARELALGGAMRAGATGALATTLNPAGLPLSQDLVFEGAYGYRPDDSASVLQLSACDSTTEAPGCFYYHYLTASPTIDGMDEHRHSHTFGFTMSRQVLPHVLIGGTVKYFSYTSDLMGESNASGFNWDVGATFKLNEYVNVAVVGYDLWGERSTQFPRAVGSGAMVRPIPQLTMAFDALWNLDATGKTGRFGGGAEYFLSSQEGQMGYPLRVGAVKDLALGGTYITGGLGITSLKIGLDLGARKEVAGGDELVVTASLRFFGPRGAGGAEL